MARKSADALGVEIATIELLPDRPLPSPAELEQPRLNPAAQRQMPLELLPPPVRWSGDWQPPEPEPEPDASLVRGFSLAGALLALAMLAWVTIDLRDGLLARTAAANQLIAHHHSIEEPSEAHMKSSPNSRWATDWKLYEASVTRVRIDGVLLLVGLISLSGGLSIFRAKHKLLRRKRNADEPT